LRTRWERNKNKTLYNARSLDYLTEKDMGNPIIAFIGAGNMGSSLIGGLIKNGYPRNKIWASDPSEEKLDHLKNNFHIETTLHNNEAINTADVIIFAIKPESFAEVLRPLADIIKKKRPLLVSIAAGILVETIEEWVGNDIPIARAMPNTPALISCGATALYANASVSEKERSLAESILRAIGLVVWVEHEPLLDIVTALSGSGPAYFFLIMESLEKAAESLGLPKETARILTLQTALGASRMALESGKPLNELRANVTSKGGTTEAAILVLEENNLREILMKALQAAKLRSKELGKVMGK
jgi:pyrroline-5-carboxylate reductase